MHAGHYFSVGGYPAVRFDERNVNGECAHCNYYGAGGKQKQYRKNLIKKIGQKEFDKLEMNALMQYSGRDKLALIDIIEKYRTINKNHDN